MKTSPLVLFLVLNIILLSCLSKEEVSLQGYYNYDPSLPLNTTTTLSDSSEVMMYDIEFTSVHNKKVYGLLSIPAAEAKLLPVIILLHGLGDRKTVDYIEYGHQYFIDHGYAVMRIDIANHGKRQENDYKFDLTGELKYWTRDIVIQSVFDLRRVIDFLETKPEIDAQRIGYYGISLGGIIGTVFCGVDQRVKVPVIALAGGNLNLMFGMEALSAETRDFFAPIDPINFVEKISPRPLLMINSENDEVISPITTKLLYKKANEPKDIKWYPSKHRDLPIDKAYGDGVDWFDQHL